MERELETLLSFWQKKEEIIAIYLLPTSGPRSKDILLLIKGSNLSYFERLELYYPREKSQKGLHVYPITCEEFSAWPPSVSQSVRQTLSQAKCLFQRDAC